MSNNPLNSLVVRERGLEPLYPKVPDPKSFFCTFSAVFNPDHHAPLSGLKYLTNKGFTDIHLSIRFISFHPYPTHRRLHERLHERYQTQK